MKSNIEASYCTQAARNKRAMERQDKRAKLHIRACDENRRVTCGIAGVLRCWLY